ncbi:lysozyme inhibitor LprI family protein [Roseateles sp. LYH14W]|uniref:Lysozyme inhibitor LprI family protein n=1 Tax=Pelomonas parva TaxID=3299032 RepID=A0ABW7EXL8_9BURK
MPLRPTITALLSMLCSLACAADPCAAPSNTIEDNACARHRFEAQDRLLNSTYQALLKQLPEKNDPPFTGEGPRALLVKAQRRWVAFRDADCAAKHQLYIGGTVRTVVYFGCMRERTEQRIKELSAAEWQGG